MVAWIFAQRLAGHSVARIAQALNGAGVPCPSAADPQRNPHRARTAWMLGAVTSVLSNPRYTGRQVWNRQRTDTRLVDPADVALGHRPVQRWNLPDGWVISARPAHGALVSEADFITAQAITASRGPVPLTEPQGPARRHYLLAGLLYCGTCGRRMESAWSNGKPAYRCRHGRTSASLPDPDRPKNSYVREAKVLAELPTLEMLPTRKHQTRPSPAGRTRRRTRGGVDLNASAPVAAVITQMHEHQVTLTWNHDAATLRASGPEASTARAR